MKNGMPAVGLEVGEKAPVFVLYVNLLPRKLRSVLARRYEEVESIDWSDF